MTDLHLTRDEVRVLRMLEQLEQELQTVSVVVLAEELDADESEVRLLVRRLHEAGLVSGIALLGAPGNFAAETTHAGRQVLRKRRPLTVLKSKAGVVLGTLTTAILAAIGQALVATPTPATHVTVVIISAGAGSVAGILGGAKIQDVLP